MKATRMMLTMWMVLVTGAAAGQELSVSPPGFAQRSSDTADGADLKIKVYVSNYAQVSSTVLAQARQQVQGIYRAAGVEAEWVDCPRVAEESREYPDCRPDGSRQDWVALRLISQSMIGGLRLDPSTFGLAAVPEDGGFGNWALVCSECAEPLTRGRRHFYGPILGALMAHEIGHLLLATTRHSAFGLMHSQWNRTELKEAAQGQMFFTAKEAQRIRAQVRERVRAQETVNVASLRSPK